MIDRISQPFEIGAAPQKPQPIRVRVGYPWGRASDGTTLHPQADSRWVFLRNLAVDCGESVRSSLAKRRPADFSFQLDVRRLRGRHGQLLLPNLLHRIAEADILLFDLGSIDDRSFNPNVLLEVGMAIALSQSSSRELFILKSAEQEVPSDLSGFLFTVYDRPDAAKEPRLHDRRGFTSALRSAIMECARARGMVGVPNSAEIETEEIPGSDDPAEVDSSVQPCEGNSQAE
jgi:hypothetical protein